MTALLEVAGLRAGYGGGAVLHGVDLTVDQGLAILLVEQDLRTAFAVADEVTVLGKGEIVHRSPTPEFRRNAPLAARLLGV